MEIEEIEIISVESLCDLINQRKVIIGDRFLVKEDRNNHHFRPHEEIIYDIRNDSATSISLNSNGRIVIEFRYLSTERMALQLEAHNLGTRSYHNLLRRK